MPYYEYVDGKSSKFWEISKSGTQVTTRYGRIGSDGQSTTKDYGTAAKAKAAYDKLIEQKTGKGYEAAKKSGAKKATKKAATKKTAKKTATKKTAKKTATKKTATKKTATKKTAAKKNTAKKTTAAPVAPSTTVLDGSARYELSGGKSNKFWEVLVDGQNVIVCYGRIGTDGTTKGKKHKSERAARAEAAKLRGEKEAKGYQRVGPGTAKAASDKKLEAAIAADADNADPYLVYGDWLQAQGDPRGELIAIQHALSNKPAAAKRRKLEAAEQDLLTRYDLHFIPEPLGTQMKEHQARKPTKKKDAWRLNYWSAESHASRGATGSSRRLTSRTSTGRRPVSHPGGPPGNPPSSVRTFPARADDRHSTSTTRTTTARSRRSCRRSTCRRFASSTWPTTTGTSRSCRGVSSAIYPRCGGGCRTSRSSRSAAAR